MISFLIKNTLKGFVSLFGVATLLFFLFNLLGDPSRMLLDQREDQEQLENIKIKYGLNLPMYKRYFNYLNDLSPISVHSNNKNDYSYLSDKKSSITWLKTKNNNFVIKFPNLRNSFQKNDKEVSSILAETLPNTLLLAVAAISIALIIGLILGIISALQVNTFLDKCIMVISTLGMSLPSFFSAIIFAWLFGFVLHKYTGLGMTGNIIEVDDFGEGTHIVWKNAILPSLVLGIRPLAVIVQLTRNSLLDVLSKDYIRTAKSKGLSVYTIVKKHALKNALNPVITTLSGWFASLLAGAVFVEYIFNWNGLGKEIVNALNSSDLPVISGSILTIAAFFILLNILVDISYSILDPSVELK
ncbi:peptide/nickel transport system permease protein [Wenyingzhuangia heitensis]|uniref:Peptide/nickel transport system permease protein n=1 Tax=Wenyingzhuangia heitensis TaxID=1487859 RepID=A0ABX0U9S3_9FLAO|nr:ABC transporter permease [Wenyingzhuangia heitensis]NIJ45583.1 peptide/nickel transport system permease protein [Wenyingzhuangia heitensis]